MQRRSFLKLAGVFAAGLGVGVLPSSAAPAQAVQPLLDVQSPSESRLTYADLERIHALFGAEAKRAWRVHYRPEYSAWINTA